VVKPLAFFWRRRRRRRRRSRGGGACHSTARTMEEDAIVPLDAFALLAMASKLSGNGGFNLRDVVMFLVLILKMQSNKYDAVY
jgi:hypothetical protein